MVCLCVNFETILLTLCIINKYKYIRFTSTYKSFM